MRIFHIHPLAIDNKSMKTLQYLEKRCPHFYSKYNLDKVIRSNFILFSEKKTYTYIDTVLLILRTGGSVKFVLVEVLMAKTISLRNRALRQFKSVK